MKSRKKLLLAAVLPLAAGVLVIGWNWWRNYAAEQAGTAAINDQQFKNYASQHQPQYSPGNNKVDTNVAELERIPPSRRICVAIGWLGFAGAEENRQIADLLVAQLNPDKNLEMVDRASLDKVLGESALSFSGLVRAESAVRVGKMLRADWFLLGSMAAVNGTNSLVARMVDGASGAVRDIALLPPGPDPAGRARALADFTRQCRASASNARSRTYLSLGDFEDTGMNSHQTGFGDQLRAYLAAALRNNTNGTLLEREGTETLLQEMRLDLAGITEEPTTNRVAQVQSAVWTVDGYYQAYENQGQQVELALQIHPAFGSKHDTTLRGTPGDVFFHVVEQTIEKTLAAAPKAAYVPSRREEIREATTMMLNDEPISGDAPLGLSSYYQTQFFEKGNEAQIRHRREEGIRTTQKLLLLDPTNRVAVLHLAVYLQDPLIQRDKEAREYFKEVADFPGNDSLSAAALADLAGNYLRTDTNEALRILAAGRERFKTNAALLEFLTDQRMIALTSLAPITPNNMPDQTREMTSEEFFTRLRNDQDNWIKTKSLQHPENHIVAFLNSFARRREAASKSYQALLPKLKETFPALAPYFVMSAFWQQTNADNPYAEEAVKTLTFCASHPDTVIEPDILFRYVSGVAVNWCQSEKQYALGVRLLQTKGHELAIALQMVSALAVLTGSPDSRSNMVAQIGGKLLALTNTVSLPDNASATNAEINLLSAHDKVLLSRCYYHLDRWQDALDVFETIVPRPVPVNWLPQFSRPWEDFTIPGYPDDADAIYRGKLGLPLPADDKLFSVGQPALQLNAPFAFSTDSNGLWVVQGSKLTRFDFDLGRNEVVFIPDTEGADDTVICQGPEQFWVGTDGDGLIEFDQATHKLLRRWTEQDGLYSGHISRLCLDKNMLWIGFGYREKGAVGRLDLTSGRVTALTPPLRPESGPFDQPVYPSEAPAEAINGMTLGLPGELYVSTAHQVLRYRIHEDKWETLPAPQCKIPPAQDYLRRYILPTTLASDGEHLLVNQTGPEEPYNYPGFVEFVPCGFMVQSLANGQREYFGTSSGLPWPISTATAVNGKDIWLGGRGYIALLDLEKKKVRKRAYMQAQTVEKLEVAGGFLWAQ